MENCYRQELKFVRDYACKAAGLDPEIAGWKTAVDAMTKQLADAQAQIEAVQQSRTCAETYLPLIAALLTVQSTHTTLTSGWCEDVCNAVEALQQERKQAEQKHLQDVAYMRSQYDSIVAMKDEVQAALDAERETSIIGKCEPPSQWNPNAQVRGDIS